MDNLVLPRRSVPTEDGELSVSFMGTVVLFLSTDVKPLFPAKGNLFFLGGDLLGEHVVR